MLFFNKGMVDRHAGIVDDPVHHAKRTGLRHPAVIIDRARPVAAARRIDLVDRDDLARFRLGQEIVVVEAPPCRRIAAKSPAFELRIATGTGPYVDDPHLEYVARRRAMHGNGAGADMNAEPFAGAASMDRCIHRPGAAPVDILDLLGPEKHALRPRISFDHAGIIVVCMVGQRFDGDEISRLDREDGFQRLAEIAPMHRRRGGRDDIVIGAPGPAGTAP